MSEDLRRAADAFWLSSEQRSWVYGRMSQKNSDGTFTLDVVGRPGWVYVRLGPEGLQGTTMAFNQGAPRIHDVPIRMRRENNRLVIYGVSNVGGYLEAFLGPGAAGIGSVGPHTHRIGSGLTYEIEALRFEPGRVWPDTGLQVGINPFRYWTGAVWETYPGGILDLTSYQPATANTWAWVLVGVDPDTNTEVAVAGTAQGLTTPLTIDQIDDIAFSNDIPLAAFRFRADDIDLTDMIRWQDARSWVDYPAAGATGVSTGTIDAIMTDADASIMVDADGNVMVES